jgi:hypothetical protein
VDGFESKQTYFSITPPKERHWYHGNGIVIRIWGGPRLSSAVARTWVKMKIIFYQCQIWERKDGRTNINGIG